MKKNQKLREIINHYGIKKQLKHFQTEIFELNEAVLNYEKDSIRDFVNAIYRNCYNFLVDNRNIPKLKDDRREHVIEEIADVMVMLKQIQLHYNIKTETINEIMSYKIDRQLERINGESNETNN